MRSRSNRFRVRAPPGPVAVPDRAWRFPWHFLLPQHFQINPNLIWIYPMKNLILQHAPIAVQNMLIGAYNSLLYRRRHAGNYQEMLDYYEGFAAASPRELADEQARRLAGFLDYATEHSPWYQPYRGKALQDFPILEKQDLLNNLERICTLSEKEGMVSLTGGTTGASMKVIYTASDMQERFAILDGFRASYGYRLGRRTAWFSGKDLVRPKDLARGNCYRDDWINNIRFFSTFHITRKNFYKYWQALIDFAPEYIVGFPSSVYDLCKIALEYGVSRPGMVATFFPTAETVLAEHREVIGKVLGCRLVDQYASSEGAPFILQCRHGFLHIHPLTGIFEVVDDRMQPAREGEILVTSFTTHGTPLIRYRIGDRLKLAAEDFRCPCGSAHPVVEHIDGRTNDFIWSPENGRVNLGNISNCTKDARGITCFQIVQRAKDAIDVTLVVNPLFTEAEEKAFLRALRQRIGDSIRISLARAPEIPRERSGKFRIVKNLINPAELPR